MTPEEHHALAKDIEARLRRDFSALQCSVRPHLDTFTSEPIALLIFEVHAVSPLLQIAYTIIGDELYGESDIASLATHIGTLLTHRVHTAS